ncbi:MAG: serine phosphatase [Candidatus Atelocyanobacterium thalassa isolate SIO64986]|uniref:Serine phosphatase n=1 Tax=Candidatus Atelocyanobacterium thalassa isolate SIO64986 TaxID=1527444 RepID=A0A086CG61_9CHRO|nr:MAG: serine phosphatase [Candidatus Atelocyanobacterium thalassa isolate SIO64986]
MPSLADTITIKSIPSKSLKKYDLISSLSSTEPMSILLLKEAMTNLCREQNKIQNLLSSLGFALRSFNNLNQFLELAPLMAARVTDAEGSALILVNSDGYISLEQLYCQDRQMNQEIREAISSVINKTNNRQIKSILSPSLDEKISKVLGKRICLYSTPILVKNVERGRTYIFSSNSEYLWTQNKRKLLQLVSDQMSAAITNDELTIELRSKERQDRELEIASEIQLRLLPRQCPTIKGVNLAARCQTASRVGGDYYDFIPTNYDQFLQNKEIKQDEKFTCVPWSIVIGDVMGKGVPAGLIMTMTRGMLRAEVLHRHSPAQILQHLNHFMYVDLDNSHRFVTLFYSEYNPKTGCLSYSNAAHNPPLLWKAITHSIQKLDTEGMLIGLDPDSQYENGQVQLASGDVVLYYTDGFTDAVNKKGLRFDEKNLIKVFEEGCQRYRNSQEILDYVFNQIENFIGSENDDNDDMTLVVMRIK